MATDTTVLSAPPAVTLISRIAAAAPPERAALVSAQGTLTYRQLLHRARVLAGRLASQAGPVLIYGHKEPAVVVAFLAAVRCGRPYIPVDPSAPPARVARMLDLARPGLVVTARDLPRELTQALAARAIGVIALDPAAEDCEADRPSPPLDRLLPYRPDDPAYIMFTSGTTGDPKGVVVPYRGLDHFSTWLLASQLFRRGAETFLNQAPFNFDLSVMDLYGALLSGGTLFMISREEIADPRLLFARLQDTPLTTWVSTPSFARFCLAEPRFGRSLLPALDRFLFCGETLPPAVVRDLWQRFPGAAIWNTYGPTEATVAVTAIRLGPADLAGEGALPVGYPAAGMEVWCADPAEPQRRCPAGTEGEIVIAGPQVALGYLGVAAGAGNPFLRLPSGQPAYRTGDCGVVDPTTGLLYCRGRLDRQVKVHGYRLELEEIESHLRALPGVADAVVQVVERDGQPDYLVAMLVPAVATGPALPAGALALTHYVRARLAEKLPVYALPRKVRLLTEAPLTANGKLDRRAREARPV